ncbi:hypothetical protein CHU98_g11935, partial [Xylaria longipes]
MRTNYHGRETGCAKGDNAAHVTSRDDGATKSEQQETPRVFFGFSAVRQLTPTAAGASSRPPQPPSTAALAVCALQVSVVDYPAQAESLPTPKARSWHSAHHIPLKNRPRRPSAIDTQHCPRLLRRIAIPKTKPTTQRHHLIMTNDSTSAGAGAATNGSTKASFTVKAGLAQMLKG